MPRINDNLTSKQIAGTNYGYSHTEVDDLGASEYTLVTLAVDRSGSVASFRRDLIDCIKEVIQACQASPKADNLLLRVITFANDVVEFHGFRSLESIRLDDYEHCLDQDGQTCLFLASKNAFDATYDYGRDLIDNDFSVNGIVIVLTDGCENASFNTRQEDVRQALERLESNGGKSVETIKTILVGVNLQSYGVKQYLEDYRAGVGFDQFVPLEDASASTLAKLADFVSRSISSQSQKLGTGVKSESLKF